MSLEIANSRAPMASAPMKYLPDGSVDWGNMWDSFCGLAQAGGPPHRATMLYAQENADPQDKSYGVAVNEIIRGIAAVSGLTAWAAQPGWVAVRCTSAEMAGWLAEAMCQENVQARSAGMLLLVPVGDYFTVKGEIKNVITAVAKTTHYWAAHLPTEVKLTLAWQGLFKQFRQRLARWLEHIFHFTGGYRDTTI
jgi:sirohydrochlorin cobaltochelatase